VAGVEFLPLRVTDTAAQRIDQLHAALAGRRPANLYLLDFSGGLPFLRACCESADAVTLLDHHKTAAEDCADATALPANLRPVLDMGLCGTTVTAAHFGLTSDRLATMLPGGSVQAERLTRLWRYVEDVSNASPRACTSTILHPPPFRPIPAERPVEARAAR